MIEIPALTAEVIEHRFIKRHCPACQAWKTPPATVIDGQILGQGRSGVRLASLIGTLRTTPPIASRSPLSTLSLIRSALCESRLEVSRRASPLWRRP